MTLQYKTISISDLKPFHIRSIRADVVEKVKERIKDGFNPARPLSVVQDGSSYIVADGNHRLEALMSIGAADVPCVVYPEGDPYRIAVDGNADEDTYAPMDVFDWCELIGKMRDEGLTQAAIGERIGWTRESVRDHIALIDSVGADILRECMEHQNGRAPANGANAPKTTFTEGWFRTSGLYKLCDEYQIRMMGEFFADKCAWNGNKVKSEARKYLQWQEWIEAAESLLENMANMAEVVKLVENGSIRSDVQFRRLIDKLNEASKNKLMCGDCVAEIEKLKDASIDLVITDPPYGIDYTSNYSKYSEYVTKTPIAGDQDIRGALELLDNTLKALDTKLTANAHAYIFTSWRLASDFASVISEYLEVKNFIIWNKGNASMGDLEGAWGNMYEVCIFATRGNRKLNTRKFDVVNVPRVPTTKAIHPTQKPEELIKQFLEASAQSKDTVIDPFMGSGSTIKAVKSYGGGLCYVGIELDEERFKKARIYIDGGE